MRDKPITSTTQRKGLAITLGVALAGAAIAGCSTAGASSAAAPTLQITPADGAQNVLPGTPITIATKHGKVNAVTVTTASGQVAGTLTKNGQWTSTEPLATGTNYTIKATAIGADNKKVTVTNTFQTLTAKKTFTATITPLGTDFNINDEIRAHTYGVGIPITVQFSRPIVNKAAVERAIEIRSSHPVVGAWNWQNSQTVVFRTRQYWPQNTTVNVTANFDGVEAAPGVYGTKNVTKSISIGPSLIVVASTRTHYMRVYYKNRLLGHWPISTGRPGDDTPDGTYLTTFQNNPQLMTGPGYSLEVPWSVDFTYSGDFIHDAYWSVSVQGSANVSHGCINTSPWHAEIYYKKAVPGDPVTVMGSPARGIPGNGWTEWFLTWNNWLKGSATGQAVEAGPNGSTFVSPATLAATTNNGPMYQTFAGNPRANT